MFTRIQCLEYFIFYCATVLLCVSCCEGICRQLTTSLFCEKSPSCMLSRGIHLKGSFTLLPDLSCLKYSELYISSASPKSATLMIPLPSILWWWKITEIQPHAIYSASKNVNNIIISISYILLGHCHTIQSDIYLTARNGGLETELVF